VPCLRLLSAPAGEEEQGVRRERCCLLVRPPRRPEGANRISFDLIVPAYSAQDPKGFNGKLNAAKVNQFVSCALSDADCRIRIPRRGTLLLRRRAAVSSPSGREVRSDRIDKRVSGPIG
jgi:hypothetical protein